MNEAKFLMDEQKNMSFDNVKRISIDPRFQVSYSSYYIIGLRRL